ncbi:unnamed protein product [Ambrosiozyma monospora]|uniref:Unnamed protein product n=1 Tax=Ambrosiozyma monospora TaxID=43982 RepID=A0A9W6SYA6_AMBMO|nr:unnamed protein product [Ambrosiozyma monospora]
MKFSTLSASALFLVSKALADETVQLFVKSDDSALSGKGLNAPHEGAGINYVFANTDDGASLSLNYDGSSLTSPLTVNGGSSTANQYFSVADGAVTLTVQASASGFTFADDGTLEYNGSADGFEACKNINDPYQYSTENYAIVYKSDSGDSCVPIKLYKKGGDSSSSSSSSAPASSAAASSTTSSESESKTSSEVAPSSTVSSYVVTVSGDVQTVYTTVPCPAASSTSVAPSTIATVSTSCTSTQPSVVLAEGAAADFKPQGVFALAGGLAAALLI